MTSRGRYLRNSFARASAGLEAVEQPPVGQVERDADRRAQRFRRPPGLGQADFRARRQRRRLAVGQVNDAHPVALPGQLRQRAAAGDFDIVGMGPTASTSTGCNNSLMENPRP